MKRKWKRVFALLMAFALVIAGGSSMMLSRTAAASEPEPEPQGIEFPEVDPATLLKDIILYQGDPTTSAPVAGGTLSVDETYSMVVTLTDKIMLQGHEISGADPAAGYKMVIPEKDYRLKSDIPKVIVKGILGDEATSTSEDVQEEINGEMVTVGRYTLSYNPDTELGELSFVFADIGTVLYENGHATIDNCNFSLETTIKTEYITNPGGQIELGTYRFTVGEKTIAYPQIHKTAVGGTTSNNDMTTVISDEDGFVYFTITIQLPKDVDASNFDNFYSGDLVLTDHMAAGLKLDKNSFYIHYGDDNGITQIYADIAEENADGSTDFSIKLPEYSGRVYTLTYRAEAVFDEGKKIFEVNSHNAAILNTPNEDGTVTPISRASSAVNLLIKDGTKAELEVVKKTGTLVGNPLDGKFQWEITVTNKGHAPAKDVVIDDTANLAYWNLEEGTLSVKNGENEVSYEDINTDKTSLFKIQLKDELPVGKTVTVTYETTPVDQNDLTGTTFNMTNYQNKVAVSGFNFAPVSKPPVGIGVNYAQPIFNKAGQAGGSENQNGQGNYGFLPTDGAIFWEISIGAPGRPIESGSTIREYISDDMTFIGLVNSWGGKNEAGYHDWYNNDIKPKEDENGNFKYYNDVPYIDIVTNEDGTPQVETDEDGSYITLQINDRINDLFDPNHKLNNSDNEYTRYFSVITELTPEKRAEITENGSNGGTFRNVAALYDADGEKITSESATRNVTSSNKIEKNGSVDYNKGLVKWTISLNKDNFFGTLNGASIVDTLDENLTLVEGEDEIVYQGTYENGRISIPPRSEDVTTPMYYTYDADTNQIVFELGNITDRATITYYTKVNEDAFMDVEDKLKVENTAQLRLDGLDDDQQLAPVPAFVTLPGNVLEKDGKRIGHTNQMEYTIVFNSAQIELPENVTITDTMGTHLMLDPDSIQIHTAKVEGQGYVTNGTPTGYLTSGALHSDIKKLEEWTDWEKSETRNEDGTNVLTIQLHNEDKDAQTYVITYSVRAMKLSASSPISEETAYQNTVSAAQITNPSTVSKTSFSKSAVSGADFSGMEYLFIKKVDDAGNPLMGATFTITAPNGKTLTQTTDESGLAVFRNVVDTNWTVSEIKAPEGFKATDLQGEEAIANPRRNGSPDEALVVQNRELTSVSGQKVWDDFDNVYNTRPVDEDGNTSITLSLLANDEPAMDANGDKVPPLTVDDSNGWEFNFDAYELYKYDEEGALIEYTVEEVAIPGYDSDVTVTNAGIVVTNTLQDSFEVRITKNLGTISNTGQATFVFGVDVISAADESKWNGVCAVTHNAAYSTESNTISIPAKWGDEIIVSEIYKGGNYRATSADSIPIDWATVQYDPDEDVYFFEVSFDNTFDNTLNSGGSVINRYESDGQNYRVTQGNIR